MVLQAIKYSRGQLEILDQLKLPHAEEYDGIYSSTDAWHAIKDMRTRGAPAIAIVAALALAVELTNTKLSSVAEEVKIFITEKLDYLVTSRPTAVNLADAAGKLRKITEEAAASEGASGEAVREAYVAAAEKMLVDDVSDNENIGKHGAEWIMKNTEAGKQGPVSMMTHCNTGSLATAGYGTALGVIRSLHANGSLKHAFCSETRPYNQGSRLTAFELVHDKIPATLITDSMAAALLRLRGGSENIAGIVVGADRVAANGDTANKIGTYSLAILAKHHGVKFLVAAPRTTIDLKTKSGSDIVIEERPGKEVTLVKGPRHDGVTLDLGVVETISIAANGIGVWNPAFDVTPAELIDGIITEVGVVEKDSNGVFHLDEVFKMEGSEVKPSTVGGL
ncbi:Methylthioribose-1-phosphate isomerase [Alternaria alternata]|jgi:methylthioribose-1-phosphate isomerase|uniref:Methylthioribose-1-phosphate isomerase n=2 Tax=Alternaria alternata complex TaxID=187734 RepID=A0A177DPF0_ALTAL|nr:Methylthioribose-1-phosphate isomerase [Alternaria alternata]XP_051586732.1 S-methyl-5-thioribose-1-phosphate isomerase [Alternaria postmessia]RII10207.1 methylthioribose-1-phosphate isomerase [Alternaria sp. MG1]RYN18908.1 Methylthioribose-1-phosphate isomerase [Alternaria tenuissima]KAH6843992.1 Methylthioribose-1-phosphate isomerase [Alternaria alternata]KAI5374029.1 S-methyl-5-thioribose-1-phosphate isomerase [Alternaria postmessia]OAG21327.1 Methylthioribose-1-phosphate isomerase [Alt